MESISSKDNCKITRKIFQDQLSKIVKTETGPALGTLQRLYAMEPWIQYGSKQHKKVLKSNKDVQERWKSSGQLIHVQFEPEEPLLGIVWDFLSLDLAWCAINQINQHSLRTYMRSMMIKLPCVPSLSQVSCA